MGSAAVDEVWSGEAFLGSRYAFSEMPRERPVTKASADQEAPRQNFATGLQEKAYLEGRPPRGEAAHPQPSELSRAEQGEREHARR